MTTNFSAQFHAQWMSAIRNLFDRGMNGHRLQPPLPQGIENEYFGLLFGEHNRDAFIFRDDAQRVEGLRLLCQCSNCVLAQAEFVLTRKCELLGLGAHSTSILFDAHDPNAVEFITRERSSLEDDIEARKLQERKKDLDEKAELRSQIGKLERRFQDLVKETRGLIRDHKGQLWTRAELIAMSQQQQREGIESHEAS